MVSVNFSHVFVLYGGAQCNQINRQKQKLLIKSIGNGIYVCKRASFGEFSYFHKGYSLLCREQIVVITHTYNIG